MAIACFGFLTLPPPAAERSSPCLNSCMTRSTVSFCGLDSRAAVVSILSV
jgi:hypothetical protein